MAKSFIQRGIEVATAAALVAGGIAGCGSGEQQPPADPVIVVTSPPDTPESGPPNIDHMLVGNKEEKIVAVTNRIVIMGATCLAEQAGDAMQREGFDTFSNREAAKGPDGLEGTKDDELNVEVARDRGLTALRFTIRDRYRGNSVEAVMASDTNQPAFREVTPDQMEAARLGFLLMAGEAASVPLSGRTSNGELAASVNRDGADPTKWELHNQTDERWAPTGVKGLTQWQEYTFSVGDAMIQSQGIPDCGLLSDGSGTGK